MKLRDFPAEPLQRWQRQWWQAACSATTRVAWHAQRSLANLAFPPICAMCAQDSEQPFDSLPLCAECRRTFDSPVGPICHRCAAPAPAAAIKSAGCIHCEKTAFRFHHIAALGVYQGAMQQAVLRMKHAPGEALSLVAGRLLARAIRAVHWPHEPQLVVAVPMHWTRKLWRGVNSAALLAEGVAAELRLPLALDAVRSIRIAARQSSLTPSRRRRNLRNAFAISGRYDLTGAHVLVIDDVLTTGTTANAVAQVLRLAGAQTVSLGVVARGIGLV